MRSREPSPRGASRGADAKRIFRAPELMLLVICLGCVPTDFASADTVNIFMLAVQLEFFFGHYMCWLAIYVERFTMTDEVSALETETFPPPRITRTLARIIRNQ